MSKYYSIPIKIISFVTLFAFIFTQAALGYEGQSLSRELQKSHLRLQQPDKSYIGPALASALGGQFKQVEHSDLVTIPAVEDLTNTIRVKSDAIGENQFKNATAAFFGILGGIGLGILARPDIAISAFSKNGWFFVVGVVLIHSLAYTLFAAKEKRFKISFDWFVSKFIFAASVPGAAMTIGLGLSSQAVQNSLDVMLKGHITPLSMTIAMIIVLVLNTLVHSYKYVTIKDMKQKLKSEFISFVKFLAPIALVIVSFLITAKTGLLQNMPPIEKAKIWEKIDEIYSPEYFGLGLAVFVATSAFIVANSIVQFIDIIKSRKLFLQNRIAKPKAFDFRRTFVLTSFFTVFGSTFFTRIMEYYSSVVPKGREFYYTGPIAYEGFFLQRVFLLPFYLRQ